MGKRPENFKQFCPTCHREGCGSYRRGFSAGFVDFGSDDRPLAPNGCYGRGYADGQKELDQSADHEGQARG